jgi:hypothetical protein
MHTPRSNASARHRVIICRITSLDYGGLRKAELSATSGIAGFAANATSIYIYNYGNNM